MTVYPTGLHETPSPIEAIDQSVLNARGLFVVEGLDADLADQLTTRSKEEQIREFCPNDSTRFGNLAQVQSWLKKGRLALPLIRTMGVDKELVGFGWMGPGVPSADEPQIEGARTTFAIRVYSQATGQGNALPYTQAILAAHEACYSNEGVWLEAWGDNPAAVRTYENTGFIHHSRIPGSRHGKSADRLYMTLGRFSINEPAS